MIRRARRDGGEMRKGRRERIEKGNHCFFKSSGFGVGQVGAQASKFGFFKLIECIIKKKRYVMV